jgi:hypothetical protein
MQQQQSQIDRLLLGSFLLSFAWHHTSWCLDSSVSTCGLIFWVVALLLLLLCGVVLWIDLLGGCAAAAACRSRPPTAAVSFRPDDNTPDSRRWGVMIFRFR